MGRTTLEYTGINSSRTFDMVLRVELQIPTHPKDLPTHRKATGFPRLSIQRVLQSLCLPQLQVFEKRGDVPSQTWKHPATKATHSWNQRPIYWICRLLLLVPCNIQAQALVLAPGVCIWHLLHRAIGARIRPSARHVDGVHVQQGDLWRYHPLVRHTGRSKHH